MTKQDHSKTSSTNRINTAIQNRHRIYYRELLKEADVSTEELEEFLLPFLGDGRIDGKLELHCPECGADLGLFNKYSDIPEENECEACGQSNPFSENYLEILLEVKEGFFRGY